MSGARQQGQPFRDGADREAHGRGNEIGHLSTANQPGEDNACARAQCHGTGQRHELTQAQFDAADGALGFAASAASGLGVAARGDDDSHAATGSNGRALVEHRCTVGHRRVVRRRDVLPNREGLAGKARRVDLEKVGIEQPAVRGNDITGAKQHDISPHEFVTPDPHDSPRAAH